MKTTTLSLVACIALAGTAHAQQSYGAAITLGYNSYDIDGLDSDGPNINFDAAIASGAFTLDLGLGYDETGDDTGDVSNLSTMIAPKYWVTEDLGLGVYFERDSIDLDLGDTANLDSYGIEGTYRLPEFEANAFIGQTDLDELSDFVDATDIGIQGRVNVNERFSLFGKGVRSNFEADGEDITASTYGIGASYAITDALSVFGGYQNSSIDDVDADLSSTSLGIDYTYQNDFAPVVLSGEYSKLEGDALGIDSDGDRISIGVTFLLGDTKKKRLPSHTVSGDLSKPDRNAIGGTLSTIGF